MKIDLYAIVAQVAFPDDEMSLHEESSAVSGSSRLSRSASRFGFGCIVLLNVHAHSHEENDAEEDEDDQRHDDPEAIFLPKIEWHRTIDGIFWKEILGDAVFYQLFIIEIGVRLSAGLHRNLIGARAMENAHGDVGNGTAQIGFGNEIAAGKIIFVFIGLIIEDRHMAEGGRDLAHIVQKIFVLADLAVDEPGIVEHAGRLVERSE